LPDRGGRLADPVRLRQPSGEWIETLAKIRALEFDYLVPGHGPVQTGPAYLDTLAALFESVRTQTRELLAGGADLEKLRSEIDLSEFETELCGDDPVLRRLFKAWFVTPFTLSAYKEATGEPIVQGQEG
jgi:glyoxylase-like metal-dependent hydrolase (beta-lactamase superfamily II)